MNIESIKAKLLAYSRKHGKIHQNTLTRFFQERFLYRLSLSKYKDNLLLKGGALAYTFSGEDSRHTKDIDFLLTQLAAEQENLKIIFKEISEISVDDAVIFKPSTIKIETIQKEGNYTGTRIKIAANLGRIAQQIQIDIGVGDFVTPGPQEIEYPIILAGFPKPILAAYSIETLVAEKFNAMIELGEFNSRLKDFYDIYQFVNQCDKNILEQAIKNTFKRRKTTVRKIHPVFQIAFYEDKSRLRQWSIFLKGNQLIIIDFEDVYKVIVTHLQPIYVKLLP